MSTRQHYRMAILGSGPAGCTAALYGARAMLNPIMIEGPQPGGQLTITTDVENYPGFEAVVQGPDLVVAMRQQAEAAGAKSMQASITRVDLAQRPFKLYTGDELLITCDSLIIATGAQAKWLGLESESYFRGFGVSACAVCDGSFYRGARVFVIGGGNTAVEEALFLTKFASEVVLVHRRDQLRAEQILIARLLKNPKISVLWNSRLVSVEGKLGEPMNRSVTGLKIENLVTGEIAQQQAQGIFIAIGHSPASELFAQQLAINDRGYIEIEAGTPITSVPGVFAAGDVTDERYRQAVTAAGMGCMAALDAERFLAEN